MTDNNPAFEMFGKAWDAVQKTAVSMDGIVALLSATSADEFTAGDRALLIGVATQVTGLCAVLASLIMLLCQDAPEDVVKRLLGDSSNE